MLQQNCEFVLEAPAVTIANADVEGRGPIVGYFAKVIEVEVTAWWVECSVCGG